MAVGCVGEVAAQRRRPSLSDTKRKKEKEEVRVR